MNERQARASLHKLLITELGSPCALCGSLAKLRIHRLSPGHLGGQYTIENGQVLCQSCHQAQHPMSKFAVGERIVLNGRTPASIDLARHRPRTIVAVRYDPTKQCNYYLVGSNGRGNNDRNGNPLDGYTSYWFRSYMLHLPRRYHFKRAYRSGLAAKATPCPSQADCS